MKISGYPKERFNSGKTPLVRLQNTVVHYDNDGPDGPIITHIDQHFGQPGGDPAESFTRTLCTEDANDIGVIRVELLMLGLTIANDEHRHRLMERAVKAYDDRSLAPLCRRCLGRKRLIIMAESHLVWFDFF